MNSCLLTLAAIICFTCPNIAYSQTNSEMSQIPSGVFEFEQSNFFTTRKCLLDSIEPLRFRGEIEAWFYNYICFRGTAKTSTQIGIRLLDNGERDSPYVIFRWYPSPSIQSINFNEAGDYYKEFADSLPEQLIDNVKSFAKSCFTRYKSDKNYRSTSDEWFFAGFKSFCTFGRRGDAAHQPQFTWLVFKQ
jgi:hypothetical protein